jgi:hypothetical protein
MLCERPHLGCGAVSTDLSWSKLACVRGTSRFLGVLGLECWPQGHTCACHCACPDPQQGGSTTVTADLKLESSRI